MSNNDRLKELNDGGYNNLLLVVVVVVVIYLFVSGFNKSKKQTYLDGAGTDTNTQQAQALRDAMNRSGVSFLMDVDGTDVELIMQTGQQITDYKAVSDSYRVLFGSELTTDLSNELSRTDLQTFWNYVYKTTSTTGSSGSTGGTSTSSPINLVGKTVTANQTVNIRVDAVPYNVESDFLGRNTQATKGQVLGKYVSERVLPDIPNKGDKNVFVRYSNPAVFGLYDVYNWVLKSAVKIG
ncbi:hypothetical protein GCM10028806_19600 [Spirosoma terrae]|uniref:Uncharacterized protein n=1 Tax=Spirosoma terrae TaxID=1968276 RepID=A0A6L9L7K7_9BACT|nr:hypothetical protein [Spirosoma terrae]NDU94723.1 hypothetical protein [Spirosoma terrae]